MGAIHSRARYCKLAIFKCAVRSPSMRGYLLRHPTDGSESIYRLKKNRIERLSGIQEMDRTTLRHSGNGLNDSQAFRKWIERLSGIQEMDRTTLRHSGNGSNGSQAFRKWIERLSGIQERLKNRREESPRNHRLPFGWVS
jgi:hypothetical protein